MEPHLLNFLLEAAKAQLKEKERSFFQKVYVILPFTPSNLIYPFPQVFIGSHVDTLMILIYVTSASYSPNLHEVEKQLFWYLQFESEQTYLFIQLSEGETNCEI